MSVEVGTGIATLGGGRAFGEGGLAGGEPPLPRRNGRFPMILPRHPEYFVEQRFVDVYAMSDRKGEMTPLRIVWSDGRSFDVEEVKGTQQVKNPFGPERVLCYTVRIGEHQRKLYLHGTRWFVEAKVPVSARL